MPVIKDPIASSRSRGTVYPKEMAAGFEGRLKRVLTARWGSPSSASTSTTLQPGAQSAHRHWHRLEDEFIYVLDGEMTLDHQRRRDDADARHGRRLPGQRRRRPPPRQPLRPNDAHLPRESAPARRTRTRPIRMSICVGEKRDGVFRFFHKDGTPVLTDGQRPATRWRLAPVAAESADHRLSLYAFGADRPPLPAPADLLGIYPRGDRPARRLARLLARAVTRQPLSAGRYRWFRPGAAEPARPSLVGPLASGPLAVNRRAIAHPTSLGGALCMVRGSIRSGSTSISTGSRDCLPSNS